MELNRKVVKKVLDRMIVNKKPLKLVEILGRKINALYVKLQLKKIGLKSEVEAQKIKFDE